LLLLLLAAVSHIFKGMAPYSIFSTDFLIIMKLERNLFFLGHRKIVISFSSTRERAGGVVGEGGFANRGGGGGCRLCRREVRGEEFYKDGGVFAQCSQTDIQTGTDRRTDGLEGGLGFGSKEKERSERVREKERENAKERGRDGVLCHVRMKNKQLSDPLLTLKKRKTKVKDKKKVHKTFTNNSVS